MRWLGIAGTVLGIWILLTPWAVTWVSIVCGVVIAASSLVAIFTAGKT